ncbi:sterol 14 alpha-demethylase [Mycosarcoma maydis]|uniref:Lanosterol 14-alpha demethylase n=1 Tax=Mycosarcoma maydis TaxID=5270 RepID=CP51_MYCMD|nr:sterol 14 alpha-demethylase [Ustilago maydis 521]P49602.1 RecName: Full=Lanosterol 14-alpha demethylase; AltName: Full=CYPLI; AltName: Full=Cytochrome P450 51; AltName: Full=Cytochrome P450-14DM; AltName: Full=Cytochrome P450-LIA1; AltName: Full=Sterol 14-alpha demethylase [Ustilago maydis 521]KIS68081.1 sterol 14 alpha-demethylase [Ustilago maydis 521]CAA88176.1 sterol 14 alpha-demethylase [Ustilago maydis]|eukprot:XP_011390148.1 sterol 14 alpha-demethylase [Ustilago maydis 521]
MVASSSSATASLLDQLFALTPLADSSAWIKTITVLVLLPLLAVVLNVASQLLLATPKNHPPVVFHFVPVIGSAIYYGIDPYKFFFECREKYGDVFTFVLLGRKITVALGPKGSNLVFNAKHQQVTAEDAYTHLTTPVFGKEVVYDVPNAVFMEQKKFVKVGLSIENFRVYVPQIVDEVREYIKSDARFSALKTRKTITVDIFQAMSELIILTASRTLQGKEVRQGLDKSFAQLYHDLDSGFTPINFVIPNLPLPSNFKRDRAQKKMSQFYQDIVAKRRAAGASTSADDASGENDMIAALIEQKYKNGRALSGVEIAHMMIALLMAGQHTSSATSSWAFLRLASRPEIIEELYEEQLNVYSDGHGGLRELDYETQKTSVPLLDAVVKETLRLHPPLHSIMRYVKSDLAVPPTLSSPTSTKSEPDAHYVIPKGHYIMAAPGVSQVDPQIWKSSDQFDPHRWLDATTAAAMQDSGEDKQDFGFGMISTGANSPYLPFGAGRHRCIGEQFAYLQIGVILATFVRIFKWHLDSKFPDPDYQSMVVLPSKNGCAIVLTPRAESLHLD